MAEIGVERLGAGDGKKHRAKRDEADDAVMDHESDGVERIDREKHFRVPEDRGKRRQSDDEEPRQHHRPEKRGHAGRAARLHRKQQEQDDDGQRHDIGFERGRDELDAFDRRKYRQRRRDHGIAVKQRPADDAQEDDHAGAARDPALRQRHQRQCAALAVVVGAEQDHDVFQGHHDDQCPEDQRDDPEHGLGGWLPSARGSDHRFAKGVEGASADVAIDDANAAQRQRAKASGRMGIAMRIGRRRFRGGSYYIGIHGKRASKCFTAAKRAAYSLALQA